MIYEYLIFNLFILAGPVCFSFDSKVRYYRYWKYALAGVVVVMVPFLVWDTMVVHKHWWFNHQYTLPFRVAGIPPGEILFFVSVPFACLFVWQILLTFYKRNSIFNQKFVYGIALALVPLGIYFFVQNRVYTALVCAAMILTVLIDRVYKTYIMNQKQTLYLMLLVTGFILVFNGYLTARPLVLYGERFMTGIRIWTIPVEDFVYGYALILLNVIVYEKLKERQHV